MQNYQRERGARAIYQWIGQFEPLVTGLIEGPILSDVPRKPNVAYIETLIGVEQGSTMKLTILEKNDTTFEFLSKLLVMRRRHVWGNFCLIYNHEKLLNDDAILRDFSMKNNDQLQFTGHVPSRGAGRHSGAKKRRFFHGLLKSTEKY